MNSRISIYYYLILILATGGCCPALKIDNSPVPKLHRTKSTYHKQSSLAPEKDKPEAKLDEVIVGVFDSPNIEQVEQAIRIFQLHRAKGGLVSDTAWSPFLEAMFAFLKQPAKNMPFSPLIRARVAAEFELDSQQRKNDGVDPELEQVVMVLLVRIDAKMREIRTLRLGREYDPKPYVEGKYCWPLSYGLITSGFGLRKDPLNRKNTRFHAGLDLAAAPNEPVHCIYRGTVIQAGWSGNWGRMIRIRHPDAVESVYAHLSTVLVKEDQEVTRGEVIGLLGRSGRTTGHHLHFGFYLEGQAVDPMDHLPAVPMSYSDIVPGVAFGRNE